MSVLALEALRCGYGEAMVIRDVSLAVGPGEALALLGKNGMGKSTLLKGIMGFLPRQAGTGAFDGRVLAGMQVPKRDQKAFQKFLDALGYEYVDETRNPAYRLFLG